MILNFDTDTFEKLIEGVLHLDRYGQIIDFNHSAKPWLKSCVHAADKIKALVAKTVREGIKAPLLVDLFPKVDGSKPFVDVYLCGDGKDGFALIFTTVRANSEVEQDAWKRPGICDLVGDEIRHQLNQLIQFLGEIKESKSFSESTPLREHALHLRSLFVAMEELSMLANVANMVPGERLSVVNLLKESIASIKLRHREYYIDAIAPEPAAEVGSVYGNAVWVQCAFTALLQSLEKGAPGRSNIVLTVRQSGGFLVLCARPSSVYDVSNAEPVRTEPSKDPVLHLGASIRIPLARRIVDLHGGQLKVNWMDGDDPARSNAVESFTLQLPTGGPGKDRDAHCENCSVNQQATAFARDLAALMPPTHKQIEIPEIERTV